MKICIQNEADPKKLLDLKTSAKEVIQIYRKNKKD